jgi:hypothetical protein
MQARSFLTFEVSLMRSFSKALVRLLLLSALISSALPASAAQPQQREPQASKERLDLADVLTQETDFVPQSEGALDQLIEVAKHFKIPMGIEWTESAHAQNPPLSLPRGATVQELIVAILLQTPGSQMVLENGVLHIQRSALVDDPRNLLNLRISKFSVKNQNLFAARAALRLAVEMTLHPGEYTEGYLSDSGYPPGHAFDVNNITFHSSDVAVREILDHLIKANGNALWVVLLNRNSLQAAASSSRAPVEARRSSGLGLTSARPPLQKNAFRYLELDLQFIPLADGANNTHIKTKVFTAPEKP